MPKILATKEDWLKLGFLRFQENGDKGIVVEEMAKSLKVNKSSFYHHFKTKKDFISCIIDFWIGFDTQSIIEEVESLEDPKTRFVKLVELAFKKDNHLDFNFYLKKYARNKKHIRDIINEIDQTRINYVAILLVNLGFSKKEATVKARIFYNFLIGYHEMNRYEPESKSYVSDVLMEITHFIPSKF